MINSHRKSGYSIIDLKLLIAATTIILAMTLPAIARGRARSGVEVSKNNLIALGEAHMLYAADWKGRQVTYVVDDLSQYGSGTWAYEQYEDEHGEPHPPLLLGWACDEDGDCGLWGYWMTSAGNWGMCEPMGWPGWSYSSMVGFGAFRFPNAKQFHDYVAGRFYEETFYPPNDTVPYELVEPLFDEPFEYVPLDQALYLSSYCFSPAAMFSPDVMRAEPDGGWQSPWTLLDGFQSPALSHALYPNLKTLMLEHHWNQDAPPDPCNPMMEGYWYGDCEPYYFNHALASAPATLFYDMSVRLLPNAEVLAADEQLIGQTGYGLWSRDTELGEDGYFSQFAYDDLQLSHHILTTDGILGRDTLLSGATPSNLRSAK